MTTQTPQSPGTTSNGSDVTLTGSETGASVRERAGHVGGTAKDEAAGVAQEVKYQARDLVGEARGQVRQQLDTQRGRVSDLLREISDELEQMAERSDKNGVASDLVRQVAMRTRDARGYLDGGGDLVGDVRRFARRRPGTFLLGALAAGVLAGRATRAAAAARKQGESKESDNDTFYSESYPSSGLSQTTGYSQATGYGQTSTAPASGYTTNPGYGTTAGYATGTEAGYTPDYATTTGYPAGTESPSAAAYPGTTDQYGNPIPASGYASPETLPSATVDPTYPGTLRSDGEGRA